MQTYEATDTVSRSKSVRTLPNRRLQLGVVLLFLIAGIAYGMHRAYRNYLYQESLAALSAVGLKLSEQGDALAITDPTLVCVTDECFRHIKDLNRRIKVNFDNCAQVSDAALAHLHGHSQLCVLSLHRTGVTDAGLKHLSGMSALEQLVLSGTAVTDAGFEQFEHHRLKKLYDLNLVATRVSDESIDDLGQIPSLRWLVVENTDVTKDGAQRLKAVNPEVLVLGIR